MPEILIVNLPKTNKTIKGCWYTGYPIHKGISKNSLNGATVYAKNNRIIPDQKIIKREFARFVQTLKRAGFKFRSLAFPSQLNQPDNLHHDAVFIRDAGLMYKDYWIQANFSVEDRKPEAQAHAQIIAQKFKKKIVTPPQGAYIEFGDVIIINTQQGSFYFGGLSRSSKEGHEFTRSIIEPDKYILINSKGYHLDTVLCPVISKNNELTALLVAKKFISSKSFRSLEKIGVPIIEIDPIDSLGNNNEPGFFAINGLSAPGVLVNSKKFLTSGVEEKLKALKIKRFVTPLTFHRFAGGACHCLTNEIR